MNIKMLKAAVAGLVLSVCGFANAGLIDFEDRSCNQCVIGDGYNNFTWNGGAGDTATLNGTTYGSSGYQVLANALSGDIVAYNPYAYNPIDIALQGTGTFDLNSIWFASAWDSTLNMSFSGFLDGVEVYTMDFEASNTEARIATFNWSGIDMLRINDTGQHFVMDNMLINSSIDEVPEPSTLAIFTLAIMGLASRRFQKQ